MFSKINKEITIFGENIETSALLQFKGAMEQSFSIKGALMADCHSGYSLPIGAVVATKDVIVPSWVGYDIGCGVGAINTKLKKSDLIGKEKEIFEEIYKNVPTGEGVYHSRKQITNIMKVEHTSVVDEIFEKHKGEQQIGTLGGGNHFIEIGYDENEEVWIVIHSGSRGIGHKIATHYMKLANLVNIDVSSIEKDFEMRNQDFLKHNPSGFYIKQKDYVKKEVERLSLGKSVEGHLGFDINSIEGKDYIKDLNFGLEFALLSRQLMIEGVLRVLKKVLGKELNLNFKLKDDGGDLINRNHNHAFFRDGYWIHRKGATHAEDGMWGVIPGNMKDGTFIVKGKGNPKSLSSSSHGAGRVMSRSVAKDNVNLEDFKNSMEGIVAKVEESTKDESCFAYKNIFEVMELQKDLVEVKHHLKPMINIKG